MFFHERNKFTLRKSQFVVTIIDRIRKDIANGHYCNSIITKIYVSINILLSKSNLATVYGSNAFILNKSVPVFFKGINIRLLLLKRSASPT